MHVVWTLRINAEFFAQGDSERSLGLPCSPFCDRGSQKVAESQRGFFDFIVSPLFNAADEYLKSYRLRMEVLAELEKNKAFWKNYQGELFDYSDPLSNVDMLRRAFGEWARHEDSEEPADLRTGLGLEAEEAVLLRMRARISERTPPDLSHQTSKANADIIQTSMPLSGRQRTRSQQWTPGELPFRSEPPWRSEQG
jgi:hypothetical protein